MGCKDDDPWPGDCGERACVHGPRQGQDGVLPARPSINRTKILVVPADWHWPDQQLPATCQERTFCSGNHALLGTAAAAGVSPTSSVNHTP